MPQRRLYIHNGYIIFMQSGITPLQRACGRRDNEDVIQFLVQSGADVNVKNVVSIYI